MWLKQHLHRRFSVSHGVRVKPCLSGWVWLKRQKLQPCKSSSGKKKKKRKTLINTNMINALNKQLLKEKKREQEQQQTFCDRWKQNLHRQNMSYFKIWWWVEDVENHGKYAGKNKDILWTLHGVWWKPWRKLRKYAMKKKKNACVFVITWSKHHAMPYLVRSLIIEW